MAMRELVTGAAACTAPDSSSPNPLSALSRTFFGSSSKQQERLNDIPVPSSTIQRDRFHGEAYDHLSSLPGSELDQEFSDSNPQVSNFLHGFHSCSEGKLEEIWDDVHGAHFSSPESIFQLEAHERKGRFHNQLTTNGSSQKLLSNFLHSFIDSSHGGVPSYPPSSCLFGLSECDKKCIRDRSSIMAHHLFVDKSEEYINDQVGTLLSSLNIDINSLSHPSSERFHELDNYWKECHGCARPNNHVVDGWIADFQQRGIDKRELDNWSAEFHQQQQSTAIRESGGPLASHRVAMEQTRFLAQTLAQDNNPKFQNSKFFQFVSKMSRGELIINDNQIKETSTPSEDWATEFLRGNSHLSSETGHAEVFQRSHSWIDEFNMGKEMRQPVGDSWVDDFSKLHLRDWAEEFGHQLGETTLTNNSADDFTNAYDEFLNSQLNTEPHSQSSSGIYIFSNVNPYVGHTHPFKEGKELFRKGLLSEAILALEAEVLKNPESSEGWRLLGTAHAENDDDQQAIAATMRAQEIDPTNLEVLLTLGVSHTNELQQAVALRYLSGWLRNHPSYGSLVPQELYGSLYCNDVISLFNDAVQASPNVADLHIVLGVLYNLSREFDRAIASFETALKLKPQDYSLWNKLGATQANSVQSADAIAAYQRALDLKPNYVRAWANMGISYANQGMYEESIYYYVRALSMNPKADNAWRYLRISLSCASRQDMIEACDSRNLEVLQMHFPLQ